MRSKSPSGSSAPKDDGTADAPPGSACSSSLAGAREPKSPFPEVRYAVPRDVLYALERVFDEPAIGRIVVAYRPWYVLSHLAFIGGRFGSVTRPGRIYTSIPESRFFGFDRHVLHEYFHVVQQWDRERMTRLGYLASCRRREREANEFAAANLERYRDLRRRAPAH